MLAVLPLLAQDLNSQSKSTTMDTPSCVANGVEASELRGLSFGCHRCDGAATVMSCSPPPADSNTYLSWFDSMTPAGVNSVFQKELRKPLSEFPLRRI